VSITTRMATVPSVLKKRSLGSLIPCSGCVLVLLTWVLCATASAGSALTGTKCEAPEEVAEGTIWTLSVRSGTCRQARYLARRWSAIVGDAGSTSRIGRFGCAGRLKVSCRADSGTRVKFRWRAPNRPMVGYYKGAAPQSWMRLRLQDHLDPGPGDSDAPVMEGVDENGSMHIMVFSRERLGFGMSMTCPNAGRWQSDGQVSIPTYRGAGTSFSKSAIEVVQAPGNPGPSVVMNWTIQGKFLSSRVIEGTFRMVWDYYNANSDPPAHRRRCDSTATWRVRQIGPLELAPDGVIQSSPY
jgi:hypothetical protein